MKREGDSLVVRIDREPADILGQLLARTTEKIKEKKQEKSLSEVSVDFEKKRSIESQPIPYLEHTHAMCIAKVSKTYRNLNQVQTSPLPASIQQRCSIRLCHDWLSALLLPPDDNDQ